MEANELVTAYRELDRRRRWAEVCMESDTPEQYDERQAEILTRREQVLTLARKVAANMGATGNPLWQLVAAMEQGDNAAEKEIWREVFATLKTHGGQVLTREEIGAIVNWDKKTFSNKKLPLKATLNEWRTLLEPYHKAAERLKIKCG